MRIVQSWLKRYLEINVSPEQLAEKLGMLGLEVERVERTGSQFDGFVVGHITEVRKHPNADRLTICTVERGNGKVQVVCGAPNVTAGQKVVLGLPGAVVPHNQHDADAKPFTLSATPIRGVDSHGMLCSERELGLGEDASGIMALPSDAETGAPFARYLGLDDVVYEVEVTPNRPDWLGHLGVAREVSIALGCQLRMPRVLLKESLPSSKSFIKIGVEDTGCIRFAARVVRGVHVGPSPEWLRRLLESAGLRSVNNIVDVTNFVMLETGQPLHAFDLDLLRGRSIVVRRKAEDGPFVTLDGNRVTVPAGTLMVCDAEREISIAGIMGGENSAISEKTTDIVIESANWDPASIRRASRALGLKTDASFRFERGADPNGVVYALGRAAELIRETAGGTLLMGAVDIYRKKVAPAKIALRTDRVNQILGTQLSTQTITSCLRQLGIVRIRAFKYGGLFEVPTFRVDIAREVDLIEEVARVYGYDRIEPASSAPMVLPSTVPIIPVSSLVRDSLISCGYREAITIPLTDRKGSSLGGAQAVPLLNPLSGDMGILRTSLIPGLLEVVAHNLRHGNANLRLFEVGHVFCREASGRKAIVEDFVEEERVGLALTGLANPPYWADVNRSVDIFDLKGDITALLGNLSLDKCRLIPYSTSNSLVEEAIDVILKEASAGFLGRVKEDVLTQYGIEHPVYVAEIQLQAFSSHRSKKYEPLPRFPRVKRDLAFVVDADTNAGTVEETIRSASSGLLKSVVLFDLYMGDRLGPGKKSLAFALDLVSPEKTLTDAEIDDEIRRIAAVVEKSLGAVLRTS
jgi:phenylalanyl-tRNA synthetase beta chain